MSCSQGLVRMADEVVSSLHDPEWSVRPPAEKTSHIERVEALAIPALREALRFRGVTVEGCVHTPGSYEDLVWKVDCTVQTGSGDLRVSIRVRDARGRLFRDEYRRQFTLTYPEVIEERPDRGELHDYEDARGIDLFFYCIYSDDRPLEWVLVDFRIIREDYGRFRSMGTLQRMPSGRKQFHWWRIEDVYRAYGGPAVYTSPGHPAMFEILKI